MKVVAMLAALLLSKKGFQQAHNNAQLDVKYLVVCGDMCTVCVELQSSRVAHTVDSILPEGHIQLGKPSTKKPFSRICWLQCLKFHLGIQCLAKF